MRKFIDLSHPVVDGVVTYPGLPAPVIRSHLSHEESRARYASDTEFHIARIELISNTGTYLDAPFHRFREGPDVAGLELSRLADLEGVLVSPRSLQVETPAAPAKDRAMGQDILDGVEIAGSAVLVRTGWSAHWGTERYFRGHPFLTAEAAERLVRQGAALVGIDSLNIDDTADLERPVHTLLLRAGIPVVEHLTGLERLPERGFRFFAVPAPVAGCGSFPVRAFAILEAEPVSVD